MVAKASQSAGVSSRGGGGAIGKVKKLSLKDYLRRTITYVVLSLLFFLFLCFLEGISSCTEATLNSRGNKVTLNSRGNKVYVCMYVCLKKVWRFGGMGWSNRVYRRTEGWVGVTGVAGILDFGRFCVVSGVLVVFNNFIVVVRQGIWSCATTTWRSIQ